ncbi:hypothetical protein [Rariglobus hedericola]|uniref:Uncharacterized protein n=1 Tax=Rariglobus hedericola TaxID=2597822 RepID=A0A556QMG7_9BACT|nr:hypothetical protein [Rariglobus hedericola]TSJ77824.1 hypothetical protein FPL22_00525 [Rariglobus hedericola]
MKTCPRCWETSDDQFDTCWRCSSPLPSAGVPAEPAPAPVAAKPKVEFRIFRGTFSTWNSLCTEAAEFASTVGPKNLISISHSEDDNDGVVTVWYWTDDYSPLH